jgi:hypothetical protein
MRLQLLYVLSIARRNKLADTRRNDDSQNRTFHPTSPTMSFLQTLYFDLHWGAKLFLGGEGLKTYFILGQRYANIKPGECR